MKVGFSYEQTESVIFISKIKWPFWGLHKEDIYSMMHTVYIHCYILFLPYETCHQLSMRPDKPFVVISWLLKKLYKRALNWHYCIVVSRSFNYHYHFFFCTEVRYFVKKKYTYYPTTCRYVRYNLSLIVQGNNLSLIVQGNNEWSKYCHKLRHW